MLGMPFPASPLLPAELTRAHLVWQEAPTRVLGVKHGHGGSLHPLAPCLGARPRCSGPAPWHSPCFHTEHIGP